MSIDEQKPKIIVVLGPTASGKSDLAVKIAKKFNGEVISADSRQIYKKLDIGSGKITKKEMDNIPHHLLDIASPKKTFTVSQYQKLTKNTLKNIIKRGKVPIICGGTGLYINSIIYDLKFPEVPPQPKLRKKLEKLSTEELFKKLQKLDSKRAKNIDKHNRRRLIRALEIISTTKKPIPKIASPYNDNTITRDSIAKTNYDVLKIGVKKQPEELKKLIAKRLEKRLKQGMIKEVENLHNKEKISWQRLDNLGLEYRYISRYLQGIINKEEMKNTLKKEIWRYAKRQMTWFKRDKNIIWIENKRLADELIKNFIGNNN